MQAATVLSLITICCLGNDKLRRFISEFPLQILVINALVLCRSSLSLLNTLLSLMLLARFLSQYFMKHAIFISTSRFRDHSSRSPPSILHTSFWIRMLNPFWKPRLLKLFSYIQPHENLDCYLNIRTSSHSSVKILRPVLIYISPSSSIPPFMNYLALQKYIIITIHSKSLDLITLKHAIKWTKFNIKTYGGDPSFICVIGTGIGGTLSVISGLNSCSDQNQPGFENIDTTVQLCISISGNYDKAPVIARNKLQSPFKMLQTMIANNSDSSQLQNSVDSLKTLNSLYRIPPMMVKKINFS